MTKYLKGIWRQILPFVPALVGLFVFGVLYLSTLHHWKIWPADWFDVSNWPIMTDGGDPNQEVGILYMFLVANLFVIASGTLFYLYEVGHGLNNAEAGRIAILGAWSLALLTIVGNFGWFLLFVVENSSFHETWKKIMVLAFNRGDVGYLFAATNDAFTAACFFAFLIADGLLILGYNSDLRRGRGVDRSPSRRWTFTEKKIFAWDSIMLVDLPVMLGSVVLLVLIYFLLDPTRVAFDEGVILGSTVCQLAYSQIVFMVLNYRLTSGLREQRQAA